MHFASPFGKGEGRVRVEGFQLVARRCASPHLNPLLFTKRRGGFVGRRRDGCLLRPAGVSRRDIIGIRASRLGVLFSRRFNILIYSKEIIGIVLVFDLDQTLVIVAIGFLHAFVAFVSH